MSRDLPNLSVRTLDSSDDQAARTQEDWDAEYARVYRDVEKEIGLILESPVSEAT